jgi:hypothetical protein
MLSSRLALLWEEEFDGCGETFGPGRLFVFGSGLFHEDDGGVIQRGGLEVCGQLLGELNEAAVEDGGLHTVVAGSVVSQLIHAYSDRDSSRADCERGGVAEHLTVAHLEGGAFEKAEAEEIGAVQQGVEGGYRSVGGASDGGVVGVVEDTEFMSDEGQDFGCEKLGKELAVRFERGEDGVEVGNVFVAAARSGTVDADDDERVDFVIGDQPGEGLIDLPLVVKAGFCIR